jgi:hypothetical protein
LVPVWLVFLQWLIPALATTNAVGHVLVDMAEALRQH